MSESDRRVFQALLSERGIVPAESCTAWSQRDVRAAIYELEAVTLSTDGG